MPGQAVEPHLFDPGIEAHRREQGVRCHVEIAVHTEMHGGADGVRLEILFQPTDERDLPSGAPVVLDASSWPLGPLDRHPTAVARGPFPRTLRPDLAPRCYYRPAPVMMSGSDK